MHARARAIHTETVFGCIAHTISTYRRTSTAIAGTARAVFGCIAYTISAYRRTNAAIAWTARAVFGYIAYTISAYRKTNTAIARTSRASLSIIASTIPATRRANPHTRDPAIIHTCCCLTTCRNRSTAGAVGNTTRRADPRTYISTII